MSREKGLPRLKSRHVVGTGVAGGVGGEIATWLIEAIPPEHGAWRDGLRHLIPIITIGVGGLWLLIETFVYKRAVLGYLMNKAVRDAEDALENARKAHAESKTIERLQAMVDKLRIAQMEKIIQRSDVEIFD